MAGSKVKIWKQDPSVKSIGIRSSFIHTNVETGPKDSEIQIQGMPKIFGNPDNDFLFDPNENSKEFDSVHTFTVIRQVVTMYKRVLERTGSNINFQWQWGAGEPINVYPRAGIGANAYYSRWEKSLSFFYFHPNNNETLPLVYTCRSFDIVAHETGHAILDGLKPDFWYSWHPETGGLHESFGDLTSIFTMLAQMDQCETIIAESKANLHAKTFFPALAEQFGEALYGRTSGLRNADNDLKMSEVSTQVHDISKVFTGAIYDILADIFEAYMKLDEYDPAETLFRVGKYMTNLVLISILKSPNMNATYEDVANNMIEIEKDEQRQEFIRKEFKKREILDVPRGMAEKKPQPLQWERCSGTMQHPEHIKAVNEAIEKG